MTIHYHTKYKLIVAFLVGIFFIETGMQSRCTRNEKSEKKEEKEKKETPEERKLKDNLKIIKAVYEAADKEGNYGKKAERSIAIALYNAKGGRENQVVIALSGQDGELLDPQETNDLNNSLQQLRQSYREKIASIPGYKEFVTLPYDLVALDQPAVTESIKGDILIFSGPTPVGKMTAEGFVTLYQDDQQPRRQRNLRHLDAEAILIRHLAAHADLRSNILLFSVRKICGSCGGVRYEKDLNYYKRFDFSSLELQGGKSLIGKHTMSDGFVTPISIGYVKLGLLGQFARKMEGGKLYAVEYEPTLTPSQVYTWACNRENCNKQVYQGSGNWVDVPEVN